jgi:hypothetical protein
MSVGVTSVPLESLPRVSAFNNGVTDLGATPVFSSPEPGLPRLGAGRPPFSRFGGVGGVENTPTKSRIDPMIPAISNVNDRVRSLLSCCLFDGLVCCALAKCSCWEFQSPLRRGAARGYVWLVINCVSLR